MHVCPLLPFCRFFCRFMKSAPMFLDRNFKHLAKVTNFLPPFGFKTQGKKVSLNAMVLISSGTGTDHMPPVWFEEVFLFCLLLTQLSFIQLTRTNRHNSSTNKCRHSLNGSCKPILHFLRIQKVQKARISCTRTNCRQAHTWIHECKYVREKRQHQRCQSFPCLKIQS